VRLLRVALPVTIVAVLGVIAGLAYFKPFQALSHLPIDPGQLSISGTKVVMSAPRLAGFTRDSRPYDLSARSASQDITNPDVLELQDISARVALQDKGEVTMTAASGVYDRKVDRLTLKEKVLLKSSAGYEARLTQAVVDVKSGNVVSSEPVEVLMLNGTLNANRLEVNDKGDTVRFDGGVSMNLILDHAAAGGQKAP